MFKSILCAQFTTPHEREQFSSLSRILENAFSTGDEMTILIGNYNVVHDNHRREIDALVIKSDAIIIIDFKDHVGNLHFNESSAWEIDDHLVLAGRYINPLFQIKSYKHTLYNYLSGKISILSEQGRNSNLGHINGLVLFNRAVKIINPTDIPSSYNSWFKITDMNNAVLVISNFTSREIRFSEDDKQKFLKILNVEDIHTPAENLLQPDINPTVLTPIFENKSIKPTLEGKVLDYYISCLEYEQHKQLMLKVNDNEHADNNNFRALDNDAVNFFQNPDGIIILPENSVYNNFILKERGKANPRSLFYGYSLIKSDNGIYPVFYSLLKYDPDTRSLTKPDASECLFNQSFLGSLGYVNREEIQTISDDIDILPSFQDKLNFINNLVAENNAETPLNAQSIIFFSESSSYIRNLLIELGDKGLSKEYFLNTLNNNVVSNLIAKFSVPKNKNIESVPFLEIFPMNDSQEEAVNSAINNNFSVVTGPPGTGKSQVVLNILANMIMSDKSVLFASKNNQAVDVVHKRLLTEILMPANMNGFIVRIGKQEHMRGTISHFNNLIMQINEQTYSHDENLFNILLGNQRSLNSGIIKAKEIIRQSEFHLKSLQNLKKNDEALYSPFFKNEVCSIDLELLNFLISELNSLVSRQNLDIFKKLVLRFIPFYFRNKFFKKLLELKSKLPQAILDYYNKEKVLTGKFSLSDILDRFEFLFIVKQNEKLIKIIKEFILGNIIVNRDIIFGLIDAENFLNDIINLKNEEISSLRESKIENSRNLLVEKIRKNLSSRQSISLLTDYNDLADLLNFNRQNIVNYRETMMKWENTVRSLLKILPAWSVTNLGVRNGLPLVQNLFDLVVFDEASQCDIPSAVPLFHRANNVCTIGDDLQLKHISGISETEDYAIAEQCGIPRLSGTYSKISLYDKCVKLSLRAENKIIFLNGHYRSDVKIMDFCNRYFYLPRRGAEMMHKTPTSRLVFEHKGVFWVNVVSNNNNIAHKLNKSEIDKCISLYKHFTENGKNSNVSFGIATPFRNQANNIARSLESEKINVDGIEKVTGNTIHVFQGDERDVMFLSLVVSNNATDGMVNFINYNASQLLNVGISRARSAVFVIGDKQYCISKGGILRNLAEYAEDFTFN